MTESTGRMFSISRAACTFGVPRDAFDRIFGVYDKIAKGQFVI